MLNAVYKCFPYLTEIFAWLKLTDVSMKNTSKKVFFLNNVVYKGPNDLQIDNNLLQK